MHEGHASPWRDLEEKVHNGAVAAAVTDAHVLPFQRAEVVELNWMARRMVVLLLLP